MPETMQHSEAALAWRIFSYNWVLLGLMGVALLCGMLVAGFSIEPASAALSLAITTAYIAGAYYKRQNRDPLAIFILGSTGQVLLIPVLMAPMTYVAAAADFPLRDAQLASLDRALGFDWSAYHNLIGSHATWVEGAVLAYSMIGWPLFGIPVALGIARHYRRMQEFTLAFGFSLIVTTAITVLVPAVGIYDAHTFTAGGAPFMSEAYLHHLHDFPMVRAGTLRELDLTKLTGIVTFPSFHAAAAVVYLWALWSVWWMRPIALVANGAMILATPYVGGHYFIDVLAGIGVAVAAITMAQSIANYLARPAKQSLGSATDEPTPAEAAAGNGYFEPSSPATAR
jgi:membrane-associated phospholipid phosphatase